MPQASDEDRALMARWFGGDGIDDAPVIAFLESRGYVYTPQWAWLLPTPSHTVSFEEGVCIVFLIHEWDWGHICEQAHPHYQYQRHTNV